MRSAVDVWRAWREYKGADEGRMDDSRGNVESISGISSSKSSSGREESDSGEKICCVSVVMERDWFVRWVERALQEVDNLDIAVNGRSGRGKGRYLPCRARLDTALPS
jgi:hypothetical protein